MALYWPSKKVALDIVDNPGRRPFDGDESEWTVIRVTCAELEDYDSFQAIMTHIAELVGASIPNGDAWDERNRTLHARLFAQSA